MRYSVVVKDRMLDVSVEGDVTKAGILGLWDAVDIYPNVTGILVRVRDVRWLLSADDVRELALAESKPLGVPWAVVAPDDASYGITRMYVSQVEHEEAQHAPFRDEEMAWQWLEQKSFRDGR